MKNIFIKCVMLNNFTSQPSVGLFLESYKKWTDLGYSVISIHISSAVSSTYSTAMSVAKEFNNVYVMGQWPLLEVFIII